MAEIILFTPRKELQANENLQGFIDLCRNQLTVFGADLPYDAIAWNITLTKSRKGKHNSHTLIFSTMGTAGSHRQPAAMAEPFCSFAKGYIRYMHAMKPVKSIDSRLLALRVLEASLTENGLDANPARIDTGILNRATQMCKEYYSHSTAVNIANAIKHIAAFMSENRLLHVPTAWKHGLKRDHMGTRVGREADERRAARMPSQRALEGLAEIFHMVKEPGDTVVSSVTAILCSAPDRISEVLALPQDCEVRQKRAKKAENAYGLRWWPAKGADPMIKWIIPSMAEVVEEAIRRIRRVTEDGRRVAKWYEMNPHKLYLPKDLEHLRHQKMVSMPELGWILFGGECDPTSPLAWVRAKKIETTRDLNAKSRPNYVKFADVENAVLRMLPNGFPILDERTGLKYSDALCVVLRNSLVGSRATLQCMIEPISYSHVQIRLGNMESANSIFATFGITEDDGTPVRISTHQFRHYLNTLAQRGGLSQLDIAKWSGRRNVAQNATYDHLSGHELVALMRELLGDARRMIGPISTVAKVALIPRDEFARLKIPTAHTTELGYCIHDFTMSPCQSHRDCISCEELVCVKGDVSRANRIRKMRDETAMLLELAEKAQSSQEAGASRWVVHQRSTLERLDQLCSIFDDPLVPNGAFIQQAQPKVASRLQLAQQERAALLGTDVLPFSLPVPTPASRKAPAPEVKRRKK